ncbi:MAG: pyroglutamyl-peptidase I [Alphaproteobacteria bacterium]|nr:pyroglutamyl-peptidase I [Alphaproteobacteria bacterium]
MSGPRVLITGFGPFPGVPDNPSAWLAEALAGETRGVAGTLQAEILPTSWESVAALTPSLFEVLKPEIMIHFGLCQRAQGFRIERSAHNRVARRADIGGALPASDAVLAEGPARLDTEFPAASLAAYLRAHGLEAAVSRSAGRYLCNFLYYRALAWASRQDRPTIAVFVHIPQRAAHGGACSEAELLRGAQETLRFVLDLPARESRTRETLSAVPLAVSESLRQDA